MACMYAAATGVSDENSAENNIFAGQRRRNCRRVRKDEQNSQKSVTKSVTRAKRNSQIAHYALKVVGGGSISSLGRCGRLVKGTYCVCVCVCVCVRERERERERESGAWIVGAEAECYGCIHAVGCCEAGSA
jgi:hypothetical protein